MAMTDRVSDLLTRIRNGLMARLYFVYSPYSKLCEDILKILKEEGYIMGYSKELDEKKKYFLKIELKYLYGKPVISVINRVSKPGRRKYSKMKDLEKYYNGLGIFILSTPQGVICDYNARKKNVGGEVLCSVF